MKMGICEKQISKFLSEKFRDYWNIWNNAYKLPKNTFFDNCLLLIIALLLSYLIIQEV